MKRFVLFVTLSLALIAGSALADSQPLQMVRGGWGTIHGQAINTAKALGDTVHMLGDPYNPDQLGVQASGTFQDQFGSPQWNGWTSEDETFSADSFWNVSDFMAVNGTYSMWCGTDFNGDPGYGNAWNQSLMFTYQVADNSVASTVAWTGTVQNDTEPGYDYTYAEYNAGGVWTAVGGPWDGNRTYNIIANFTYQPADYVGSGNNEIQLRVRFNSDGAWSDEDGLWGTNGACQIDDLSVTVNGTQVEFEDFEDQVSDNWFPVLDPGVGDFAALYSNLVDGDPCVSNLSPQVAFIDDGNVVPGTGGSPCVTWCYGPGGYIVNNTGGLMGPDFHISNLIISPELTWPAGAEAAYFAFDVYRHEELGAFGTWPGMFYQWGVRSTNSGNPADLATAPWNDRNFVYYGGPDYIRPVNVVTDLLEPGRTHVQASMRVIEYGYVWGWVGTDGTPAPYFDNAAFVAYPFAGPGMASRDIDIANDSFPSIGAIDYINLGNNDVAFDAAMNISGDILDAGDSIWFDISAIRAGSSLNDMPKLYVRMKANPLFDGFRVLPANFSQTGNIIEGWVYGDSTFTSNGTLVADRYNFDLPDVDFFYPGDVIHYYVEAQDNVAGDIGTSLIPGDTTGFANFDHNLQYDSDFIVRALPTMFSGTEGDQPEMLFWNDFGDRGGENEWLYALQMLGFKEGVDYDLYYTNGPSSGVGNGLGARATSDQLTYYSTLLYTAGDLSVNLLANGDFNNDPSPDLQVVDSWFAQGSKNAFFTGDDLVTGLLDAGADGAAFVNNYFSVNYVDKSILSLIGDQTAPKVAAISGNGIIARVPEWIAYGGCFGINSFDAIEAVGTAARIAEFTDPNGNTGAYPYAAAVYNNYSNYNADVVMMPVDFMFLNNAPGWTAPAGYAGFPARAVILEDILNGFGMFGGSNPVGVTPDAPLAVSNFPNPFNPSTKIQLTLPKTGDVSIKIFNVRGELVRTLVNERKEAGTHDIMWHGDSDQGNQVASGVYFYEVRANGETKINKMALVK